MAKLPKDWRKRADGRIDVVIGHAADLSLIGAKGLGLRIGYSENEQDLQALSDTGQSPKQYQILLPPQIARSLGQALLDMAAKSDLDGVEAQLRN